jgi:drug/metabolite transporter (DMT)-like permease
MATPLRREQRFAVYENTVEALQNLRQMDRADSAVRTPGFFQHAQIHLPPGRAPWLTHCVFRKKADAALALSLVFAVFLWGGNNSGTKLIVATWPPIWTGGSRFLCAGLLLLAVLRWTAWLGAKNPVTPTIRKQLWWQGGLSLAAYIVSFNQALRYTSASHVALYLGASPVWALLWEGRPARNWTTLHRYGAAVLALAGVFILFRPALRVANGDWRGEALGLLASVLWTNFGRQCRMLGAHLSGAEVSAHTMWRAGVLLLPLGGVEIVKSGLVMRADLLLVQLYCIVAGGVVAFAIWNNALRHWPASQVLLFNNLIPLSTMSWAHFWLKEPVTPTFWLAMILIVAGVVLSQTNWQKILAATALPPE